MKVAHIDYKDKNLYGKLLESFVGTGFAVIENHPILPMTINAVYNEWNEFFANPLQKKFWTHAEGKQNGYFPLNSEKAKDRSVFDFKEFFHYYDGDKLPLMVGESTLRLRRELNSLGIRLLTGLDAVVPTQIWNKIEEPLGEMPVNSPSTLFRILNYPAIPEGLPGGAVRSAPHEDINLITLLPAATEPGLQVKDNQGKWHDVDTNPGNIVVNAGDMLKEATGGYIPSTTHQVINPSGAAAKKARMSMPMFMHPRPDVRLSERYTANEYLIKRLKEIGIL